MVVGCELTNLKARQNHHYISTRRDDRNLPPNPAVCSAMKDSAPVSAALAPFSALRWLTRVGLLLVVLLGAQPAPAADKPASRPNILLILCDDLGFETLNCYGGTSYKTPNLDALAKSGIRFKNGYATPLCSPSRVELMTGRYGFRTSWINLIGRGGDDANEYFDPKKEKTFGNMLKAAGYATAMAGKWQLANFQEYPDHIKECGFDESCAWTWIYGTEKTSRYWQPGIWQNGKKRSAADKQFGEDVFCDFLIDFMTRQKDQPFFAYYPMVLVHDPLVPTPDSKGGAAEKSGKKAKKGKKGQTEGNWFPDMVNYMDKTVARLVAALDKSGQRENTVIIFTGDNGTARHITSMLGATPVKGGKGTTTEFGTHVPLIVSWKGTTAAGQVKEDLVDFTDVLPTLAELSGAALPKNVVLDGRSFAFQLRGEKGHPRDWIFSQLGQERLIRDARYMLHSSGHIYDIRQDPFERNNLSATAGAAPARKALQAVLDKMK
jgi:arylsulfatase A